jgi:hypothetical protein
MASLAAPVAQIIKQFGAGTGLSDADREFARMAAAGDIGLTSKSIKRIMEINDRAATNLIKRYTEKAPPGEQITIPEQAQPAQQEGGFEADAEGWVDLGGGIRLRKKAQ